MRVLTVGNLYPPHDLGGGYELVWRSAVEHLVDQGHDVRVLTGDLRRGESADAGDVQRDLRWYWRDHAYPRRSLLECLAIERHNLRVLDRHLEHYGPDVVSFWAMGGLSMSLLERARRDALPAVAFVHDDWLDYGRRADGWHRRIRERGRRRLGAWAERRFDVPARVDLDRAAQYVFVSATTLNRARVSGVAPVDTSIAHSGIDSRFIDPAPAREWSWRLLYVGRLDPRKGIDTAVEALARLPQASLRLVGDGDPQYVRSLEDLARRLGVSARVEFAGQVDSGDLGTLYAETDATVFPVRWEEPWGLVPLESMARARPVLATGRGGSGEYLRDRGNCLLVRAGDAAGLAAGVEALAASAELRERIVAGGLATASRHTAQAFNETVAATLENATQTPRPGRAAEAGPPRLSVVIPTYRRREALRRTLAALERQQTAPTEFEVIVVDDPVEDDSEEVAQTVAAPERPYPVLHLSRKKPGVSAARNMGWREARAPLVLFLGDDIVAGPGLLAEHLAWHADHPSERTGVLGLVRWASDLRVTPFMRWLEHGTQFDYRTIQGTKAGFGHFYTSNISLKRSMLERSGGFDEERFPFLYEDLELGYRLFQDGFRLLYNRRARAGHWHASTIEEWQRRMAATARAEHTWVELHPGLRPYFKERLAAAAARPPYRGRKGRMLLRWVPRRTPWLGRRVWDNATIYYRQQLAPGFLQAWEEASSESGFKLSSSRAGTPPASV